MEYFKLYANVLPVKGAKMYIICDLQRNNYHYIPEGMYELLTKYADKTIEETKTFYSNDENNDIDQYIDFLIDKEYGLITNEPESFPSIDLKFELPEKINNAIIDSNFNSKHDFGSIFSQLEHLDCKYLELRFYDVIRFDNLTNILNLTINKRFKNISIYLKFYPEIKNDIDRFFSANSFGNIGGIYIHSSDDNKVDVIALTDIYYSTVVLSSADCCGKIDRKLFSINLPTYLEGLNFNTCLNKKISIDALGNIKNCPSMIKSFGDMENTSLSEVINNEDFLKLWSVTKDQIAVCKDCQFRYICTDCRAFVEDFYEKPFKCLYDPYLNVWN
ncbi:grasp-with-spasm system SPASM domain peptide maturase [Flavobacterium sp. UBA6046]|jgi:SPASM domain peptide maturase of grasp-with-spasm system|uniref:grasp-with-spasm system SPASM domain peptide maturase n=1 Tax=Flavobacterium sp. UBA6046 TaxID=1946552 RepID=UPI0025BDAA01|nr:grasp-with-spasm system SPASM domain peptide maturase [Flavobacterium sp. UBA6046]